ncbi:MAG: hypothetical protein M1833_004335 [Piccolia ochrophora]|nr:MAG: hypothetical protein M1833_004335 [Piccolia ochrophora]
MGLGGSGSGSSSAIEYGNQAERLSFQPRDQDDESLGSTRAVEATFVTPQDPIIELENGETLPAVPIEEATKLNQLKDEVDLGQPPRHDHAADHEKGTEPQSTSARSRIGSKASDDPSATLGSAVPPSRTNPLFPPLPLYGPPGLLIKLQCATFRVSSFFLSLSFLMVIVLGSAFTSIPLMFRHIGLRLTFRDPNARRPFYEAEKRRKRERREANKAWKHRERRRGKVELAEDNEEDAEQNDGYEPTEGGKDPLICDVGYYARRVGLDVEEFKVKTEDGFIIRLWHVYNPKEYAPRPSESREPKGPKVFAQHEGASRNDHPGPDDELNDVKKRKYPVLLVHGLLQSAGAYCTNDDDSLAFFLCKSGYDVWLGNNRCGFTPDHSLLDYSDPRMWAWNIRQMGVIDLPALISRVLSETGFMKLGLICHSQGTTETFVALAKDQRPDLGRHISVFCALAPAAYAGPLIGKAYFKFMRVISPGLFRIIFGIHAFIPFMMTMHQLLPGKLYGALGYRVFSFLFNWTDDRWEQDLRDRMFQFAPVYVSAECMRWWLGRECFAKQKCILATREENKLEDIQDEEADKDLDSPSDESTAADGSNEKLTGGADHVKSHRSMAWYDDQAPPFALWVAGSDDLVDGRKLLRRFERGREPHVNLVHSKIIDEYEHLDVIWAMDMIEKVGKEVREVIYKTMPEESRKVCRVPKECEEIRF